MAEGSKKRRPSQSSSRSGADKKIRPVSADTSVFSQRSSDDRQLIRAKSVFRGHLDPYFPHTRRSEAWLPTSDDYTFRIQVISTTTDVNTDLFKKAVQGLVKICFPQDILEEIGIDVVTRHMHSEKACEQNIAKMKDLFRSEIIHRVTWMLAEYLDAPSKVEASVKAIMAASASLHGDKIGEDVLGDITKSLCKLRKQFSGDSTRRLAINTDMETIASTISDYDALQRDNDALIQSDELEVDEATTGASEKLVEEGVEPLQLSKKHLKKHNQDSIHEGLAKGSDIQDHANDPAALQGLEDPSFEHTREGKEGKISTSWRWDVKGNVSSTSVALNFKRASDLFAYHALPIVKRQLGSQAKRKELRQEIQSMLVGMSDGEFGKWVRSYQKLKRGDTTMLQRDFLTNALSSQHAISTVPTFSDTSYQASSTARSFANIRMQGEKHTDVQILPGVETATVKHEPSVDRGVRKASSHNEVHTTCYGVDMSSSSTQNLATEDNFANTICNELNFAGVSRFVTISRTPDQIRSLTPIIDVLLGCNSFEHQRSDKLVDILVGRLTSRTATQVVRFPQFNGQTMVQTAQELRFELLRCIEVGALKHRKCNVEMKITPWILANIAKFPELLSEPFVFVHIMPFRTTVLDLICDLPRSFSIADESAIKAQIISALHQRGFSRRFTHGPNRLPICDHVESILAEHGTDEIMKRGLLERRLRLLAFEHREKFPELADTTLVITWERETYQVWQAK